MGRPAHCAMFHAGADENRSREPERARVGARIETERQIMNWADILVAATPAERIQLIWFTTPTCARSGCAAGCGCGALSAVPRRWPVRSSASRTRAVVAVRRAYRTAEGVDTLLRRLPSSRIAWAMTSSGCACPSSAAPERGTTRMWSCSGCGAQRRAWAENFVTFLARRARIRSILLFGRSGHHALTTVVGMVALEAMACGTRSLRPRWRLFAGRADRLPRARR